MSEKILPAQPSPAAANTAPLPSSEHLVPLPNSPDHVRRGHASAQCIEALNSLRTYSGQLAELNNEPEPKHPDGRIQEQLMTRLGLRRVAVIREIEKYRNAIATQAEKGDTSVILKLLKEQARSAKTQSQHSTKANIQASAKVTTASQAHINSIRRHSDFAGYVAAPEARFKEAEKRAKEARVAQYDAGFGNKHSTGRAFKRATEELREASREFATYKRPEAATAKQAAWTMADTQDAELASLQDQLDREHPDEYTTQVDELWRSLKENHDVKIHALQVAAGEASELLASHDPLAADIDSDTDTQVTEALARMAQGIDELSRHDSARVEELGAYVQLRYRLEERRIARDLSNGRVSTETEYTKVGRGIAINVGSNYEMAIYDDGSLERNGDGRRWPNGAAWQPIHRLQLELNRTIDTDTPLSGLTSNALSKFRQWEQTRTPDSVRSAHAALLTAANTYNYRADELDRTISANRTSIGVLRSYSFDNLDPQTRAQIESEISRRGLTGHSIEELEDSLAKMELEASNYRQGANGLLYRAVYLEVGAKRVKPAATKRPKGPQAAEPASRVEIRPSGVIRLENATINGETSNWLLGPDGTAAKDTESQPEQPAEQQPSRTRRIARAAGRTATLGRAFKNK